MIVSYVNIYYYKHVQTFTKDVAEMLHNCLERNVRV